MKDISRLSVVIVLIALAIVALLGSLKERLCAQYRKPFAWHL